MKIVWHFHTENKSLMPISIILATIFLTAIGIACIDLPPSGVIIYVFDQNPAGLDDGNEWVTIHHPTNKSVDIGNWTLKTTNGSTVSVWIAEGTTIYPEAYYTYSPSYRWLYNNNESCSRSQKTLKGFIPRERNKGNQI